MHFVQCQFIDQVVFNGRRCDITTISLKRDIEPVVIDSVPADFRTAVLNNNPVTVICFKIIMDGISGDDAAGAFVDTDPVKIIVVNFAALNRTVGGLPDGDPVIVAIYPAVFNGVI